MIRNGVETLVSSSIEGPEGCVEVTFITSDVENLLEDHDEISCTARNGIIPDQGSDTRVAMAGEKKSLMVVIGGDPADIGMDVEVFDLGNPSRYMRSAAQVLQYKHNR